MRWSNAFIPTLRDDPADAEATSHKLLVRGGFMRQLMSGSYSVLPLGVRVCRKITAIVRDEMEKIGGQEFALPALHPAEVWQQSGRWDLIGDELFRLRDRKNADLCLGVTHEEVFTLLAAELRSYRQLPQTWFQFQTKFRDEPRPKSGLLRVREFTMKDSYSFDLDATGLDESFRRHFDAYRRIFERTGLDTVAVEASSGSMGGSESVEFMVESDAGEDWIAACARCGYAANLEKATSTLAAVDDAPGPDRPEKFPTPGIRTIEELAGFEGGAPPERQIKTLVYVLDGKTVLVLLRGDHALNEQKLLDGTASAACRPATDAEMRAALGASAGSLGAVGVDALPVVADAALEGRTDMTTGANEDGFHLRGVDVARDVRVRGFLDLREAESGEPTPILMGSYGIGIGRCMAAVVERCHDERGIVWPVSVAPYEVVITCVNVKEVAVQEVGAQLYEALRESGVDVLLDDRDASPGVKFKDAELIGVPYRITVGPRGLANDEVEVVRRRDGRKRSLDLHKAAEDVAETIAEERR
jgi:prolyl-tRNA synthetase